MPAFFLTGALFLASIPLFAIAAPVSQAPTYTNLLNCRDDFMITTRCMAGLYPQNLGCATKADAICSTPDIL
ncbi:MAG: hypothetical protein Q9221_008719 [Calogaya cf. arnoldii]